MDELFVRLALALGLGLLVGLQRERTERTLAGLRTFALITLSGAISALVATSLGGPWFAAAGLLALAGVLVAGDVVSSLRSGMHGVTTEVAALLMFGVGAYCVVGRPSVAAAVGAGVALLLHFKEPLHARVQQLDEGDVRAAMKFVLIAVVVLPAMPDRTFGPFDVLNPHDIWLMVVLIVGISVAGWVAWKLVGGTAGTVLSGILGGVVSSTATTAANARRSRAQPEASALAAVVVAIASAVAYARMLIEIGFVAPGALGVLGPPLLVMLVVAAVAAGVMLLLARGGEAASAVEDDPASLKPALAFAGLYAVVLLAVAVARAWLGESGLYAVAVVSGLTDVDAITLTTAQLVRDTGLDPGVGWRVMLLASLANLAFKAGMVAVLGARAMAWRFAPFLLVTFAAGGLLFAAWPDGLVLEMPQAIEEAAPREAP